MAVTALAAALLMPKINIRNLLTAQQLLRAAVSYAVTFPLKYAVKNLASRTALARGYI